jgi:hypothetical protein
MPWLVRVRQSTTTSNFGDFIFAGSMAAGVSDSLWSLEELVEQTSQ